MPAEGGRTVHRHRTAIGRDRLSVGARTAFEDQVLDGRRVFDYGCGRGGDVAELHRLDVNVAGWDPHFFPDKERIASDVVLLTYVLNTVEDRAERDQTLRDAWSLAKSVLVVTSRLAWERHRVRGDAYKDGVITSRRTFQHLYTTSELARYVRDVLDVQPVAARPGLVYAFRSSADRWRYLSRRYALTSLRLGESLPAAIHFYEERGRMPAAADGLEASEARAMTAAVRAGADAQLVTQGKKRTTFGLLLFLAMERFHGHVAWGSLSPDVQADVLACFGSYKHATWRASRLLGQLRDETVLRRTMRASVGKLTPTALYVHRRAVEEMPILLRIYEECGALAAGRPDEWDLLKLHHDKPMVSWLSYPDFDREPHPALRSSYHVELKGLRTGHTNFAESRNPPVLHRKHEFLHPADARAPLYERLTRAEVRAGLYARPELIGSRDGWERELQLLGRAVRGHRLVRVVSVPPPAGE
jgi:DNA phosphorothioation-associated putative methyltransferase